MRSRLARAARNTLISVAALLVLFVGVGAAYTWYIGQHAPDIAGEAPRPTKKYASFAKKPAKTSPNDPASAAVRMLTTPVAPNENASMTVSTNPEADCAIEVAYNPEDRAVASAEPEIAVKDSGLQPKTADEYGIVSWAWTFDAASPEGRWTAHVTCSHHKQSAVVQGDIEVKQP